MLKKFQDLKVWKQAHQLVLQIYTITKSFPKDELFALTSQMRRAAVSVPANIAEGFSKTTGRAKINFYNISLSSLAELEYYCILSVDLHYLSEKKKEELLDLVNEVGRMLNGLVGSVKSKY